MTMSIESRIEDSLKIELDKRSKDLRGMIVSMLLGAGRGHMGSAMSLVEILRVLYDDFVSFNPKNPQDEQRDRVILSKGHGCLALYAILCDKGFFSSDHIKDVGSFNSILGGHPEHEKIPGVEASTGALGHGLPIGVGMAMGLKIKKNNKKVVVITGDGEINEGSVWEAAMSASMNKLNNLIVMIDYNKIQSYGLTTEVIDLEPLLDKWKSFGFQAQEVNGHSISEILNALNQTKQSKNPNVIICHTIKGKGFSESENNPFWHHKNSFTSEEIEHLKNNIK